MPPASSTRWPSSSHRTAGSRTTIRRSISPGGPNARCFRVARQIASGPVTSSSPPARVSAWAWRSATTSSFPSRRAASRCKGRRCSSRRQRWTSSRPRHASSLRALWRTKCSSCTPIRRDGRRRRCPYDEFSGGSGIYAPDGKALVMAGEYTEGTLLTATLALDENHPRRDPSTCPSAGRSVKAATTIRCSATTRQVPWLDPTVARLLLV